VAVEVGDDMVTTTLRVLVSASRKLRREYVLARASPVTPCKSTHPDMRLIGGVSEMAGIPVHSPGSLRCANVVCAVANNPTSVDVMSAGQDRECAVTPLRQTLPVGLVAVGELPT
jgi:hypothetical protein